MIFFLIRLIDIIRNILILIVFIDALLSFFMSPMNPIRITLDRIVRPMLAPIQRIVPPIGGTLDLSPLILIILIEIVSSILIKLLTLL
jgi:YggT family protein